MFLESLAFRGVIIYFCVQLFSTCTDKYSMPNVLQVFLVDDNNFEYLKIIITQQTITFRLVWLLSPFPIICHYVLKACLSVKPINPVL